MTWWKLIYSDLHGIAWQLVMLAISYLLMVVRLLMDVFYLYSSEKEKWRAESVLEP